MSTKMAWMGWLMAALVLGACGDPVQKGGKGKSSNNGANNGANNGTASAACGNGVLDAGEACDSGIAEGDGVCPNTCQTPQGTCGTFSLVGSSDDCSARCELEPAACGSGDDCCPLGCDSATDGDCSNTCGDGIVEGPELCDGDCPTSCDDDNACTTDTLNGSAETCSATCTASVITSCTDNDGCCAGGCTAETDNDCSDSCGNGTLDAGELCDGDCPTSCDDGVSCTADALSGSAESCSAACVYSPITTCVGGDGCCPSGCTGQTDSDCNCAPTTSCNALNYECGSVFNGCADVSCGTCGNTEQCINNRCVETFGIGNACSPGGACADCIDQANSGWDGGYCTRGCSSDASCGGAAQCSAIDPDSGTGICMARCATNADCPRAGYDCFDFDGDGDKECAITATGSGAVGAACSSYGDCAGGQGGVCVTEARGLRGGYCSVVCVANADCGAGGHCSAWGVCLDGCNSNSDCRSAGYACYDADEDGRKECYVGATGTGAVGAACQQTWDCAGGQYGFCVQSSSGVQDGYCLQTCGSNGHTCPSGSVCIAEQSGGTEICLDQCATSTECRSGYTCTTAGTPADLVCWL